MSPFPSTNIFQDGFLTTNQLVFMKKCVSFMYMDHMDIYILIIYNWIYKWHVQFIDLYILILVWMFEMEFTYTQYT